MCQGKTPQHTCLLWWLLVTSGVPDGDQHFTCGAGVRCSGSTGSRSTLTQRASFSAPLNFFWCSLLGDQG